MPSSRSGTCQACRTATQPGDRPSESMGLPWRPLELVAAAGARAGLGFPTAGERLQVLAGGGGKVSVLVLEACKQD